MEVVDGRSDSSGALEGRAGVGSTTARGLSTASWVVDSLRSSTWVSTLDEVDNGTGGTISSWSGSLSGTKDVNLRARLGECADGKGQNGRGGKLEVHVGYV
jgi:hypothetical protein